jgi:hypothetical protein
VRIAIPLLVPVPVCDAFRVKLLIQILPSLRDSVVMIAVLVLVLALAPVPVPVYDGSELSYRYRLYLNGDIVW